MATTAGDCKDVRVKRGVDQTVSQDPRSTSAARDTLCDTGSSRIRTRALVKRPAASRRAGSVKTFRQVQTHGIEKISQWGTSNKASATHVNCSPGFIHCLSYGFYGFFYGFGSRGQTACYSYRCKVALQPGKQNSFERKLGGYSTA
jgi:hypothetical protein